jgi:hypothetical protein
MNAGMLSNDFIDTVKVAGTIADKPFLIDLIDTDTPQQSLQLTFRTGKYNPAAR